MPGGSAEERSSSASRMPGEDGDLTPAPPPALLFRCPRCLARSPLPEDTGRPAIACPSCGSELGPLVADTPSNAAGGSGELPGQTLGRFQLLQRLGAGGFGVVWKARDPQLDRVVAVKLPHPGLLGRDERERILREARTAARLRHAAIVTVYEVGLENDRLYIVSDFIEGQPLDTWLAERRPGCRESAAMCAKLADGLEHAHRLGVIHRDLKPGNIMIDCQGEPHIMDFGLAKRVEGEQTLTVEGQVLGTPAYMSPEQAKGHAHAADPRSDVYSLGVVLFELLTRERPFRGNLPMLLKQVIEDEPPSPRKFDSRVPRDLETICLKCMQKEPGRRYPSAQAAADDLRGFLAGTPVAARPVGRAARVARWCRRKPLLAGLSAAAVLGVLFGLAAATVGYVRTAAALRETRTAQAQERQAVNDLFTRVSEDRLLREPGMQRLRADLLGLARGYYEKLLAESGDQGDLREVALAHYRIGKISEEIETPAQALAHYTRAEALQRRLLAAAPGDLARLEALGDTLNAKGCTLVNQGQLEQAGVCYAEAAGARKHLAESAPQRWEFQRTLANTHMNIGLAHMRAGVERKARDPDGARHRLAAAGAEMQRAQDIRRAALPSSGNDTKLRHDLATGCYNQATLAGSTGDFAAARAHIQGAVRLFGELAKEDASRSARPDLGLQQRLANCHCLEAHMICDPIFGARKGRKDLSLPERRQLVAALPAYQEALRIMGPLAGRNPDVAEYQRALAEIRIDLGQLEEVQGHTEAAIAALSGAETALRPLLAAQPEDPRCLDLWIRTLGDLGALRPDLAQRRQALSELEALQQRIAAMAARDPPSPGADRLLGLVRDAIEQVRRRCAP